MNFASMKTRGLIKVFSTYGLSFILVWILNFMSSFMRSMVDPTVPYLVKDFLGTGVSSVEILGVIFSAESVASILASIPGGLLSDRIGRKKTIVLSSSIYVISNFFYIFSTNWYWLVTASFVRGFAYGLSLPSFHAFIADLTGAERRGTAFGVYNVSWTISGIPAPIIGGYLASKISIRSTFLVALILSFLLIALALRLKEPRVKHAPSPIKSQPKHLGASDVKPAMSFKSVIIIFSGISLLGTLSYGIQRVATPSFLVFNLNVDPLQLGIANSLGWALISSILSIPAGKLADRWGRRRLLLIGLMSAPFILLLSFSQTLGQYIFFWGLITAFGQLGTPAEAALLMDLTPRDKRARTFAFKETAVSVGLTVGPIIGGLLWAFYEPHVVIPFLLASILTVSKAPLLLMIKK
jgi:MFS family permease